MSDETSYDDDRPGILSWIAILLLVTGLSAAAGTFASMHLISTVQRIADSQKAVPDKPVATAFDSGNRLRKIAPVVTNLAAPPNTWIRLEASMVTDKMTEEDAYGMTARIGEDIAAYLRTLTPSQIEGARGLHYLREDLNERAVIRSNGKVRELIIETLVVQ